jgi:hypothetical protein
VRSGTWWGSCAAAGRTTGLRTGRWTSSRYAGNSGRGGSGQPGSFLACRTRRSSASTVWRWWTGFSGADGSAPTGICRVASSASVTPRRVWPTNSSSMTWRGAELDQVAADPRIDDRVPPALGGQTSRSRWMRSVRMSARRTATEQPLDPATTVTGRSGKVGARWSASAAQLGARGPVRRQHLESASLQPGDDAGHRPEPLGVHAVFPEAAVDQHQGGHGQHRVVPAWRWQRRVGCPRAGGGRG